jgi:hypothetical protein
MAAAMEKSKRRHILITVQLALWALYSGGVLQIYLPFSCAACPTGSKKRPCAGTVDKWIISHAQKKLGVRLVSKLRAILLMEADFNAMNKWVCGVCMLHEARKYKLIPEEIFSKKNCTADDGGLAKTLFYDIVQQTRLPVVIALVDASNYYNLIAHAIITDLPILWS